MANSKLHHTREMANMRSAYSDKSASRQTHVSYSDSVASSRSGSERMHRKTAAENTYSRRPAARPPHVHYPTYDDRIRDVPRQRIDDRVGQDDPRSSADTYASTTESDEELEEEPRKYEVPDYTALRTESPPAIAATPRDFSDLFPSNRRLLIRHDDSTLDGNMNLRLDTEVPINGRMRYMSLFHLRMHDLKDRELSLRRYCRDSGREVCHTARKTPSSAPEKRPGLQRSLSNALSHIRSKSEQKTPTLGSLKRNDSGYGSMYSVDSHEAERPRSSGNESAPEHSRTNILRLEFSNYAQVGVKRAKSKTNKRYEFEYWGTSYSWKRIVSEQHGAREVSFHLLKAGNERVLGYIQPLRLNSAALEEEHSKGGWVPQCHLWISDQKILHSQKDVSDVIVASGLLALVDDAIDFHFFENNNNKHPLFPKLQLGLEYVGPRRLINEMFNRRDNASEIPSRPPSSGRPSLNAVRSSGTRVPKSSSRRPSHERQ